MFTLIKEHMYKLIIGITLFSFCIFIGSLRNRILEMNHVTAVDTGFYLGILVGVIIMFLWYYLLKEKQNI
jgi:hypothetical protein